MKYVIVGAGLAGITLAWSLRRANIDCVLFDHRNHLSSSRVAAGLITPVTGLRLAKSWRYDTFWPIARDHYRDIEAKLETTFLYEHASLRLFQNADERDLAIKKSDPKLKADHAISDFVRWPEAISFQLNAPFGGIELTPAAFLDMNQYLDQSLATFDVIHEPFTPDHANDFSHVIYCEGYQSSPHADFPEFSFNATKGEILTIEAPELQLPMTVHGAGWIRPIPHQDAHYLVGTTYDRERLDRAPTQTGQAEIERKLQSMIRVPYRIVDHRAGIRPTIRESQPTIAMKGKLAFFNGLGSKGALAAPYYANELVALLTKNQCS